MTKRRPASQDEIARQVRAVSSLSRAALIERWTSTYGQEPPKGISRRLLERSAAYYLQVAAMGGIPPGVRRRLARLSRSGDGAATAGVVRKKPMTRLPSGTRLVREWNGRTHSVEVTDGGFLWNGRNWRSLSAVAVAITGARWSGPRFFGL